MSLLGLLIAVYLSGGPRALPALWGIYAASLAWFVFIDVGIRRAARRYRGPPRWPRLARAGLNVGVLRMAAEAVLLALLASGRLP